MVYGDHQLLANNSTLYNRRSLSNMSSSSTTNLKQGYAPIDDLYLYKKTGIRGRKKYLFYLIVVILFIVAFVNIMITFVLLSVLRLGYGMESLEFIPPGFLLRFLTEADFSTVVPIGGVVGGFKDSNLHIIGDESSVVLEKKDRHPTSLSVGPEQTALLNVDAVEIVDPNTGQAIFSTDYPTFGLPKSVKKLNVKNMKVNKIVSPVYLPLSINATQVRMRGNEGLHMTSGEVILSTSEELFLFSRNASIYLDGHRGVQLRNIEKFPKVTRNKVGGELQYKICVCMPSGRLFRVPLVRLTDGCDNVVLSDLNNPCA